jgi:hypothetical protein
MIHTNTFLETTEGALAHLEEHGKAGHDVPQKAFDDLRARKGGEM